MFEGLDSFSNRYEIRSQFPKDTYYAVFYAEYEPRITEFNIAFNVLNTKLKWTHTKGFEDIIIITAFWWQKTNNFYIVVENRSDLFNAFVYELNPNDLQNPFIQTVSKFFIFFVIKINIYIIFRT